MKRYVDLTHPIEEGMPVWPGDPQPEIRDVTDLHQEAASVQSFRMHNHLGTHLDAPSHFIRNGMTLDRIPLDTLLGRAVVLDLRGKGKGDVIEEEDLLPSARRLRPGGRVLLMTGWDRSFRPDAFFDGFPCLTPSAAHYLASLKIGLLGMDSPSPGPIADPGQRIHRMLLGAGIILLEAVKDLALIGADECDLIVLPPLFKGFSGGPCRVVASVDG